MSTRMRLAFALGAALAIAFGCATALAEPTPTEKAAALALFKEARALIEKGEYARACPKLEESLRLDQAIGTQLNLADCYEKTGRNASAWALFTEAAALARDAGQQKRVDVARERAAALEPKLSKLSVTVTQPVDGMEIKRDGEPLSKTLWGTPLPVDPGKHELVVAAPGMETWRTEVDVEGEGTVVNVDVPVLEEAAAPPPPAPVAPPPKQPAPEPGPPDDGGDAGGTLVISGAVAAALGAGAVVAGGVLTALAVGDNDDSRAHCAPSDATLCDQDGLALRDDAINQQRAAIALYVSGGAVAAAGAAMLIVGVTSTSESDAAALVPSPGGLGLRLRW